MIDLTRLNGTRFTLNCDLIKYAEATPDTTVTLISGEKLIVLEPLEELKRCVTAYRGSVLRTAWPGSALAPVARDAAPLLLQMPRRERSEERENEFRYGCAYIGI